MKEESSKLFDELIKNGYSRTDGYKTWDIANRKFLYFTDELAKGYLKMRSFDKYKKNVVEREINLMRLNKDKFVKVMGNGSFNLVDVGCGDGKKIVHLLNELGTDIGKVKYVPFSVSKLLVNMAAENVKSENIENVKEFLPHVGDWDGRNVAEVLAKLRNSKYQKNVVLLLGSVIASFDIHDYLFELSRGMLTGDYLIIGNGIRTGERLVHLKTYQDKAFGDWSMPLMKYMGFVDKEVKYNARFGNSRVEFFYTLGVNKIVKHKGKKLEFKKGDEVMVGILYKYYENELRDFCKMYFSEVELVKDEENEYALVICKK
jgi:uncharacterized SAM-dependent methyltransferase